MTSATEHARILIAGILPNRSDRLDRALRDLTPSQIPDLMLSNLFRLLEGYAEQVQGILTRDALVSMLQATRADAGTMAAYQETYDELQGRQVDDATFRWSLIQIRELAAERSTKLALTQGMQILTKGLDDTNGESLQGHQAARSHLLSSFADIDRDLSMQDAPEGDIRQEGKEILANYDAQEQARREGRGLGINFGVPALDAKLGGLHFGELTLLVGFTSDGKTSLCVQLAWSAAVEQGRNVVFFTTETIREQVRRRIIARHSCLPLFGLGDGINSRDIKDGTLNPEERHRFQRVVEDFNDNTGYGKIYVCQVPRGADMSYIESKVSRLSQQMDFDLCIVDYLALLKPERSRQTVREELSGILKGSKQMGTTAHNGRGIAVVSPWQVSRAARIEAERVGHYNLDATSETAETSNSSDNIISLLAPLDNEQRHCKIMAQLMKHRDGAKANAIELMVDYATNKFTGPRVIRSGVDELLNPISY